MNLDILLQTLLWKHLPVDRTENQRITVRRKHVWADALLRFRRGIDPNKHLKVTFVGEPGIDDGGPLREFFHLIISNMSQDNNLFCGPDGYRTPRINIVELGKNTFYHVGCMIALSLVHGGPTPKFFSPAVADYIIYGIDKVIANPSDVPDMAIRQKLNQVLCQ